MSHRGSWRCDVAGIENTLPAFNCTIDRLGSKLHGFECDFRQLSMNDPTSWVVFHDETMDRFTGQPTAINLEQPLLTTNPQLKIPDLIDFCHWIQTVDVPILINIEIKIGSSAGLAYLIDQLNMVNTHGNVRFVFSSFKLKIMRDLISHHQLLSLGFLIQNEEDINELHIAQNLTPNVVFVAIAYERYTRDIAMKLKALQFPIGIYFLTHDSFLTYRMDVERDLDVSFIFLED